MADARDLKSLIPKGVCGFDSRRRHGSRPLFNVQGVSCSRRPRNATKAREKASNLLFNEARSVCELVNSRVASNSLFRGTRVIFQAAEDVICRLIASGQSSC